MSFPRYEKYKDSGIEWLGEVPEGWEVFHLRRLFEICKRIAGEEGHDVLSITQKGIRIKDVDSGDGQLSMDYSKYQFVEPGDFAMNHMDLLTGYVDISLYSGVTSPDYRVFRLLNSHEHHGQYFLYLFQNAYKQKIFFPFGQGSAQLGRWRLPTDEFKAFCLPVPSIDEQRAIATFLDHETAKIDALVSEQEKLIELLKEKRQAVISHAVTKGLDPNAKMKESGVEWLGGVPEHWEVVPLKYLSRISGGGTPAKEKLEYWHGDIPWVSPKDMKSFWICNTQDKITSVAVKESATSLVAPGALLMVVRSGILQRTIPVAINTVEVSLNQDMKALRFHRDELSRYFAYLIKGFEQSWLLAWRKQGATVESIEYEYLSESLIPVPPSKEVNAILKHLDALDSRFATLKAEAKQSIQLLTERRSALISAAVTGKIDVRTWQPPADESAFPDEVRQAGMEVTP